MSFKKEDLGQFINSVITLEINTILSDGIEARPMLDPRHALYDIGRDFRERLLFLFDRYFSSEDKEKDHIQVYLNDLMATRGASPKAPATSPAGSKSAFEIYERIANYFENLEPKPNLSSADRTMLARISKQSAEIKRIFDYLRKQHSNNEEIENHLSREGINDAQQALKLEPGQLATLRRIWEVGTESVVMQTCVGITGDVTTRVVRGFEGSEFAALHKLHNGGTQVAIRTWQGIIAAIADFGRELIGLFKPWSPGLK